MVLRVMALALLSVILTGCCCWTVDLGRGGGRVISESRSVSDFDAVRLTGSGDVVIEQTGRESVTIEAEEQIVRYVRAEVQGSTLVLGLRRRPGGISIRQRRPIRYHVTVQELSAIECTGSGSVRIDELETGDLRVQVSGSGDVRIDELQADETEAGISGSGSVRIEGRAQRQRVTISGSGDYRAADLRSQEASVRILGSGTATIWVEEDLEANILGSGDVRYYGRPRVSANELGSGDVVDLGIR